MDDQMDTKPETSRTKTILLALFLILFGLVLGVLSYATLIGPILGLLLIALGIYLLWKSTQTDTPL